MSNLLYSLILPHIIYAVFLQFMSSPDVFSATLQFGNVVEIGYPDIESGEIN
jgi:hypothetical protein